MSFIDIFGGTTIYPSQVSYLAIVLTADIEMEWPLESNAPVYPAASTVDVTSVAGDYSITLPDATLASAGQTMLVNAMSGNTHDIDVVDNTGGAVATITAGTAWVLVLAGTATAAGTWRAFQLGASTATVQASALAGYGLTASSNQLSQSTTVTTINSSPRTVLATDRAALLVWEGTGAGTFNLPAAADVGNNYFLLVRNDGGGDLTVDPSSAELIDGAATLTLHTGDSATIVTDGLEWYSVGMGRDAVFAFDYTTISLAAAAATYTLSGAELNRISYKFTGLLTNNVAVVVPPTVQQYWVENATTGAFTVTLKTSGGTPVTVSQGARGIYYCNGTNIVSATTGGISVPISATDGGTGQSSYAVGDLIYASGVATLSKLADVATGNVLISGGVGVAPSWGKVGLATHVSGTLGAANGGTDNASYTVGDILYASGATALGKLADIATGNALISGGVGVAPSWGKIGLSTHISGFGTGVATALAVNVGSAGAAVVLNGALGTPSSGTLTNCTADGTNLVGYRNIPQLSKSANYTFVLADAGYHVYHPSSDNNARTFTIPANASVAYPIGTALTFVNRAATASSIAITTDTLLLSPGGTAGTRTLAQYGVATAIKTGTTEWMISGTGLT